MCGRRRCARIRRIRCRRLPASSCRSSTTTLPDQQYAVAGTIAGLKALEEAAFRPSRRRIRRQARRSCCVPGIDVPFHSTAAAQAVCRSSATKLDERAAEAHRLPWPSLVGRYIPNLVARAVRDDASEFAAEDPRGRAVRDACKSRVGRSRSVWDSLRRGRPRSLGPYCCSPNC